MWQPVLRNGSDVESLEAGELSTRDLESGRTSRTKICGKLLLAEIRKLLGQGIQLGFWRIPREWNEIAESAPNNQNELTPSCPNGMDLQL